MLVAGEILKVIGQESPNPGNTHRGDDPSIVRLMPVTVVGKDEALPFCKDFNRFGHDGEEPFQPDDLLLRFSMGQAPSARELNFRGWCA